MRLASTVLGSRATSSVAQSPRFSYPKPTGPAKYPSPRGPGIRPLPLQKTSSSSSGAAYPPRPPIKPLPQGWSRKELAVQVASPRTWAASLGDLRRESTPFKGTPPVGESKEGKKARIGRESRKLVEARYTAEEIGQAGEGGKGLWVAAETWTRQSAAGEGVTLVVTHGNGFGKETWHTAMRRAMDKGDLSPEATFGNPVRDWSVVNSSSRTPQRHIDQVIFIDNVGQGASVDVNAGKLGPVHNWVDDGRDIIAVVQQLVPAGKQVIGVGHSMGGMALVEAAEYQPELFHSLFLADAMIVPIQAVLDDPRYWQLVAGAMKRRTHWPSFEAAEEAMRASPFYARWHPDVFDLWLSHALVPHPEEGVQLATPYWAEAAAFAEPSSRADAWDKLERLTLPVGFLMAGDATATMGEEVAREMVWRAPHAANERVEGASHLIIQECPDEVGDALWRFLGQVTSANSGLQQKARL